MNNRLRTALITMIAVVWAVNFTMPLVKPNFKPPAEINLAFMGVVGLLTAGYKSNGNGDAKPAQQLEQAPPQYPPEPPAPDPPPRKRAPAKKTPAKRTPAKKTAAKKTTAKKTAVKKTTKKAVKKQPPRKRGSR